MNIPRSSPALVVAALVGIAALIIAAGVHSLVIAASLLRTAIWGLLGAAMLLEWRERQRWYMLAIAVGAGLCFAVFLMGVYQAIVVVTTSPDDGDISAIQTLADWEPVGVTVGAAGYGFLFAGTMGCILAHLRRDKAP